MRYFFSAAGRTFEQGSSRPTRNDLKESIVALEALVDAELDEELVVVVVEVLVFVAKVLAVLLVTVALVTGIVCVGVAEARMEDEAAEFRPKLLSCCWPVLVPGR